MAGGGRADYLDQALAARIALGEAIRQAREKVFIAPSGADLVGAEVELAAAEGRERRLKQALDAVKGEYDWYLSTRHRRLDCSR